MKQTVVSVMAWIAYVIEWQRQSNQKIVGPRDLFAHDTKFVTFLRACFMWNERVCGSTTVWLNTARPEPMTDAEQLEFILPLAALSEAEFDQLCRHAGLEPR
jgi:hypothetical protein